MYYKENGKEINKQVEYAFRSKAKAFAKENIGLICSREYDSIEHKVTTLTEGCFALYDCVYQALLEEAIDVGVVEGLNYITDRMVSVSILKEFDTELYRDEMLVYDEWKNLTSPFVTENLEVMRVLLDSDYDRKPKKIMWYDGEKLCFIEATPMAAALACGNKKLFEMFMNREQCWNGFYGDDALWCASQLRRNRQYEIREIHRNIVLSKNLCRLWSPEDAALLSGNLDIIRELCDNEINWRGIGDSVTEESGRLVYHDVYKHHLPDSYYWMNEAAVTYMENRYSDIHSVYRLDKIVAAANYAMLNTYLDKHNRIGKQTIGSILQRFKTPIAVSMTVGLLEELAVLTDIHCIPFNAGWMESRKNMCIHILEEYISQ